ncbi:hypothetical protein SOP93_17395 [Peribacillus frigoritolerans]|uniref:hypothetical protein n=1 Tax=Peribacillus frigoritolerans TaxID=450367 RepID=UPI002B25518C|nr:hypothetical protein [Peribacillus frigoritolerans]MEB2492938.1 hypothetical protein [Peribacillus frigoritolerans]
MDIVNVIKNLESIYLNYYDGLYTNLQLKQMLLNLYKKCDLPTAHWSNLILEAQWKYATEQDYAEKRKQLEQNRED